MAPKDRSRTYPDPDLIRPHCPAYWAASLVLAMQSGDRTRERVARQRLRRLGYIVTRATAHRGRGGER